MNEQNEAVIRMNLALNYKDVVKEQGIEQGLKTLDALYDWVRGPRQTILPVSKFEVVKQ